MYSSTSLSVISTSLCREIHSAILSSGKETSILSNSCCSLSSEEAV